MDFVQTLEHHVLDHVFLRLRIGALSLPVSRHAVMLWLSAAVALTGLPLVARSARSGRRTPALAAVEGLVVFVRDDIVLPSIGEEGRKYLSYFLSLFVFILLMNLLGLVPLDALRFLGCPSINIAGIRERGLFAYLRGLAPEGLPSWLLPLMYPVEVLGMLTKSFALTIRLFANMIAGHIVMLAFLGLVFMFHKLWIAPLSVAAAVGIVLLDVFVAVLQAYIFTLLSAIFVGGAVHSH
jgi:F-type H+-transporting ATPase subunit a